jgi:hypothetical protein
MAQASQTETCLQGPGQKTQILRDQGSKAAWLSVLQAQANVYHPCVTRQSY